MSNYDATRGSSGRFGPGNPGRPRGSRNRRLSPKRQFLTICRMEGAEQLEALQKLMQDDPGRFLEIAAVAYERNRASRPRR